MLCKNLWCEGTCEECKSEVEHVELPENIAVGLYGNLYCKKCNRFEVVNLKCTSIKCDTPNNANLRQYIRDRAI